MKTLFSGAREPVNSATHFFGAVLSVVGTVLLVFSALRGETPRSLLIAGLVFGLSLTALYCASSLYHYVHCSAPALLRLRKLDHAMIYVLIAGTYTPLLLAFSEGREGFYLTLGIWAVALCGFAMKVVWMGAPRWLSTVLYIAMGWAIVLDPAAILRMPSGCLWLIALGGLCYTLGAVIYAFKKPNLFQRFGFHELFHVFVLLGSLLHVLAVYLFIIR